MRIYIRHHDEQLGPFTEAEVRTKFASGAFSLEDRVWWDGQAEWLPLGESSLPLTRPPRVAGTIFELPPARSFDHSDPEPTGPTTSNLAIGSLTCGCLGLVVGFFTAIPAVILGHLALLEIKKNPERPGRGVAVWGLVMGYLLTPLSLALMVFYLHERPAVLLKSDEEARGKAQAAIDFSQAFAPNPAPVAKQEPVSDDILFQPPPADYSKDLKIPSSKSNASSANGPTKEAEGGTNAAPAPGR